MALNLEGGMNAATVFGEINNKALDKTGDMLLGELDAGGNRITNLPSPSWYTDAATKIYVDDSLTHHNGYVHFSDTILGRQTLTKSIDIPRGETGLLMNHGVATINNSVMIYFSTDNNTGKCFGYYQSSPVWTVRRVGGITSPLYGGASASGANDVFIDEFFIHHGSNDYIRIVFNNTSQYNRILNCTIDWEVWK